MKIFLTILILSLVIIIHEFGHYITSIYFKAKVLEFSIGMGPKIFGYKKFSIRLLPLGGYVKLDEESLESIERYKQIIIMFAGIFMNILLAYIILIYFTKLNIFKALVELVFIISKILSAFLHISLKDLTGPVGIYTAVGRATNILGVFRGSLYLVLLISINLAIVNLLPIPGLDGSRIYLNLLKMLGLKISKKIEERIYVAGFLILVFLTIFVLVQDISRL